MLIGFSPLILQWVKGHLVCENIGIKLTFTDPKELQTYMAHNVALLRS